MSDMNWSVNLSGAGLDENRLELPYGYSREMNETYMLTATKPEGGSSAGTATATSASAAADLAKQEMLKTRKLWEAARSPVMSLIMGFGMIWMSGNRINIFPLMMLAMFTFNTLKGLFSVGTGK